MNYINVASRAASLGIRSVHAVVINGKLVETTLAGYSSGQAKSLLPLRFQGSYTRIVSSDLVIRPLLVPDCRRLWRASDAVPH